MPKSGQNANGSTILACGPSQNVDGSTILACGPSQNVDGSAILACGPSQNVDGSTILACGPSQTAGGSTVGPFEPSQNVGVRHIFNLGFGYVKMLVLNRCLSSSDANGGGFEGLSANPLSMQAGAMFHNFGCTHYSMVGESRCWESWRRWLPSKCVLSQS